MKEPRSIPGSPPPGRLVRRPGTGLGGHLLRGSGFVLVAIGSLAAVELPAAGPPPASRDLPAAWFGWGNDFFVTIPSRYVDDYRTNRFTAGLGWQDWFACLDHSLLTLLNPSEATPRWGETDPYAPVRFGRRRIDELSLAVGRRWEGGGALRWWAGLGPGLRLAGKFGGAGLQDSVHAGLGSVRQELPYEREDPLASGYLHAHAGLRLQPWPGPLALRCDGTWVSTQRDEHQGRLGAALGWLGAHGSLWAGYDLAVRSGTEPGSVAAAVARHEAGWWQVIGADWGPFTFQAAVNRTRGASEGILTFRAPPAPGTATWPGAEIQFGLRAGGSLDPGNGFFTALAMDPWWLDPDHPLAQRLALTLEYRRSELDVPFTYDLDAAWDEILAGGELRLLPSPRRGIEINPFIAVQGGWHRGSLHTPGLARPAWAEAAATAVLHVGLGLRLGWAGEGWRSGLAAVWERTQVAREAGVDYFQQTGPGEFENGTIHLAQAGHEVVVRWFAHLGW